MDWFTEMRVRDHCICASRPINRPTHPHGPGPGRNTTRFLSRTPAAPDAFKFQPQKVISCTLVRRKVQLEPYALPYCRRETLFRGTKVGFHRTSLVAGVSDYGGCASFSSTSERA